MGYPNTVKNIYNSQYCDFSIFSKASPNPLPMHHSGVSTALAERLWNGMHAADIAAVPVLGGWVDRHEGYDIVRLPSLPLPDLNSVWADREIELTTLASEVARIEADAIPAGVLTWLGRTPGVEAAARILGLTVDEPN